METRNDILNELIAISPLIAGIRKVNIFSVPEGYFNSISETVLVCIQEGIDHTPIIDQSVGIPEGYFDHLAASILDKIKAGETASAEISHLSPLLHAIQNIKVLEVPGGYFEKLPGIIKEKITTYDATTEINVISGLLADIQSNQVFEVPVGYFNGLPEEILQKVQPVSPKVISMPRRSLFMRYAVAAMMTGALTLGLYKYLDKPVSTVTPEQGVASLDASIEKGKIMNEQQFNEALQNLTENDIAKYLEKNGNITDVAILVNNIDDSNLPSQDDYLLDESTLDNYLKEIDKTTLNN